MFKLQKCWIKKMFKFGKILIQKKWLISKKLISLSASNSQTNKNVFAFKYVLENVEKTKFC